MNNNNSWVSGTLKMRSLIIKERTSSQFVGREKVDGILCYKIFLGINGGGEIKKDFTTSTLKVIAK